MSEPTGCCQTGHTVKPSCVKCREYVHPCPICGKKRIAIQEQHDKRLRTLQKELCEKLATLADAHAKGEHCTEEEVVMSSKPKRHYISTLRARQSRCGLDCEDLDKVTTDKTKVTCRNCLTLLRNYD